MLDKYERADVHKSYRIAKNPNAQIKILAQLYNTSEDEIKEIVGIKKTEDPALPVETDKKGYAIHSLETKQKVVNAYLVDGLSKRKISERFGIPLGTVSRWLAEANKQQKLLRSEKHLQDPQESNAEPVSTDIFTTSETLVLSTLERKKKGLAINLAFEAATIDMEFSNTFKSMRSAIATLERYALIDTTTKTQMLECITKADAFRAGILYAAGLNGGQL